MTKSYTLWTMFFISSCSVCCHFLFVPTLRSSSMISVLFFFFLNDTAPTEISSLPLHDALPICALRILCRLLQRNHVPRRSFCRRILNRPRFAVRCHALMGIFQRCFLPGFPLGRVNPRPRDRKSTRLNSSHSQISYAVFCLKKKK